MPKILRIFAVWVAVAAISLLAAIVAGCASDPDLDGLKTPEFVSVSANAEGNSLTLDCIYKGSGVGLCGFVLSRGGKLVKKQEASTRSDGSFSLTVNELEYNTEYTYYAWISNGSAEVHSNTGVARTEKEPSIDIPDANFKAYCVKNFDMDGDGEISEEEALRVTVISFYSDIKHQNVKSLKGIEHFKNLVELSCSGNPDLESNHLGQITSLDLSNNTSLVMLNCDNNLLSSLDLSKNTLLKDLYCRWNFLAALDVRNNKELIRMHCSGNQIAAIDVSNNTALRDFWCENNLLKGLDVSKNTALIYLGFSGNSISSIDLSNNTALDKLWCVSNQLSTIDVSHSTALTEFNCGVNQLTSLDVSKNTALTTLVCCYNQLSSLSLASNTALQELECHTNKLTSLDISRNASLSKLSAWPQIGTLAELFKKQNQSVTYYEGAFFENVIDPADYGTKIIEVE